MAESSIRGSTLQALLASYALAKGKHTVVPLTLTEIARRLGVTRAAVSAWCRGVRHPGPDAIAGIAELLGVPESVVERAAKRSYLRT